MTQIEYEQTSYYHETGNEWGSVLKDQGKLGEYKTFQALESFEKEGCKFLFNVYVPKGDGTTSECDVLLLTPRGIVAIESKNYSGWIFGEQSSRNWMETQKTGSKHQFYNPVWQNTTHINSLKGLLRYPKFPIWNVVAFSDNCEFRSLTITDSEAHVVQYRELASLATSLLNEASERMDVESVYSQLKPYAQPVDETIIKHDEEVKRAQGKRASENCDVPPRKSDVDKEAYYSPVSATPQNLKTGTKKAKYIAIAAVALLILLGVWLSQKPSTEPNITVLTTASNETTLADNQVAFNLDGGQTVATVDSVEFAYSDTGKKIVTVTGTYENVSVAGGINFDFNNGLKHLAVTNQNRVPLMQETWFIDANTKLLPGGKLTITESFQVEDDDTEVVVSFVYPNNHGVRQGEFRYPIT